MDQCIYYVLLQGTHIRKMEFLQAEKIKTRGGGGFLSQFYHNDVQGIVF